MDFDDGEDENVRRHFIKTDQLCLQKKNDKNYTRFGGIDQNLNYIKRKNIYA